MVDPIERLRAANPEPACPTPAIEEVWRRIDAETVPRERPRSTRAPRLGAVMVAVSGLIAVAIAVIAITQLVPRHHSSTSASAGASALIAKIGVLRRPQTPADRVPAHLHFQGRTGQIVPGLTRLVYTSHGIRMYIVVVTPARHNALWGPRFGDRVAIVAVTGHQARETNPIPAVDLDNADEVGQVSPRGYGHGGAVDLYGVEVVPDGVASVQWNLVNAVLKPLRPVRARANDNAVIVPRQFGLLKSAEWFDGAGGVIPTSDKAVAAAKRQMHSALVAPIIRYYEHHPQPTPPVTADFAVFSVTSPTGVRAADGDIISAPPVAKLPWDILGSIGPAGGGRPDLNDVRHVVTPSGGDVYVIPGPYGICFDSMQPSPLAEGFLGGGGGSSCTYDDSQAKRMGIAFSSGSFGQSTTYRIVPKAVHSIIVRTRDGKRKRIQVPDGIYVSPPEPMRH